MDEFHLNSDMLKDSKGCKCYSLFDNVEKSRVILWTALLSEPLSMIRFLWGDRTVFCMLTNIHDVCQNL